MTKRTFFIFIALTLGFLPFASFGQTLDKYTNVSKDCYNFWVYTPPVDPNDTHSCQPLIIFLHGNSLCGKNLERVRTYGPLHAIAMGRKIPAMILAPQNPGGAWSPDKIDHTLEWVREHYKVDPNKIYFFGMSLGAYGTFDYVGKYPHKVAAAIAMCGGTQLKQFCGLNEVPLWIIHGTADRVVPLSQSQRIVDEMKKCGDTERLIFTKISGENHGGLARAFYLSKTYDWLLSHRLDMPGHPVTPGTTLSMNDLLASYNDLRNGAVKLKVIAHNGDNSIDNDPAQPAAKKQSSGKEYYKVKKGDSLERIARKYGTSVSRLCELNNIKKGQVLREGKRIRTK